MAALLGIRWLSLDEQRSILGGETAREFGRRLIESALRSDDLGAVSVCAWAAFELELSEATTALQRALEIEATAASPYTVELAWLGSALAASTEFDAEATGKQHSVGYGLLLRFVETPQGLPDRCWRATLQERAWRRP